MHHTRLPQLVSAAALGSVLVMILMPLPAALAGGGCCFTKVSITRLDTGRAVVLTGPALTAGYDLSTFWSFGGFTRLTTTPAPSGPSYEVNRDDWDHLRYYPGAADTPGMFYYEGLYNGSSEYDHQWFSVPPEQDAALRRVLATEGLAAGATQRPWAPVVLVFALFAAAMLAVYQALGAYVRRPAAPAAI